MDDAVEGHLEEDNDQQLEMLTDVTKLQTDTNKGKRKLFERKAQQTADCVGVRPVLCLASTTVV